jgi:hypothetical protein
MKSPIEELCEKQGFALAATIDAKMAIVLKPRPWWLPHWLYKKLIRETVEIIQIV